MPGSKNPRLRPNKTMRPNNKTKTNKTTKTTSVAGLQSTRTVHQLRNSFQSGFTEQLIPERFTWVLSSKASSTGSVKPRDVPSKAKYVLPKKIVLTISSNSSSMIRVIAMCGSSDDDNHIIGQTQIRVVGQRPTRIVLGFSNTKLAKAINPVASYDLIKNCEFAIECTGDCAIAGVGTFLVGTPEDFPSVTVDSNNITAVYNGNFSDYLNHRSNLTISQEEEDVERKPSV